MLSFVTHPSLEFKSVRSLCYRVFAGESRFSWQKWLTRHPNPLWLSQVFRVLLYVSISCAVDQERKVEAEREILSRLPYEFLVDAGYKGACVAALYQLKSNLGICDVAEASEKEKDRHNQIFKL